MMNRKYSIKPNFVIDEIVELNKDGIFVDRRKKEGISVRTIKANYPRSVLIKNSSNKGLKNK